MRPVNLIVIHCSASADGHSLARVSPGGPAISAAQTIDAWHRSRGFRRAPAAAAAFNAHLPHLGYHYVLDVDGAVLAGRAITEPGAHAYGFNGESVGVCLVGTARYTEAQWAALAQLVRALADEHGIALAPPQRRRVAGWLKVRYGVCGHRDLSADQNDNGVVEPFEWTKTCPGFDVAAWLAAGLLPAAEHVFAPTAPGLDNA